MSLFFPGMNLPFKPRSLSILIFHRSLEKYQPGGGLEHALGVYDKYVVLSVLLRSVEKFSKNLKRSGESVFCIRIRLVFAEI